jgi:DNA-binding winged helix-turn-helix (wHTH) protein
MHFRFGEFELDDEAGRLTQAGEPVALPARHLGVLAALLARPGQIVSKDALVEAAWRDVAVTDNSLEQAISALRRTLRSPEAPDSPIETVPRQGYRFAGEVQRIAARASDDTLDALIAPYRAFVEGRAALETLAADRVADAESAFERALAASPDSASAHVGLATALAMRFETTRADPRPEGQALGLALRHAREACRLDPQYAEAWATLGFVLDRTGAGMDAVAALTRAVSLEPDNWRHHLRLSAVSWGEARLRAARRALTLLPGCPLAHWLAATVHVARHSLDEARRELTAGCTALADAGPSARFSGVALEWLQGLIDLSQGDDIEAMAHFDRELRSEPAGHLYARECCANVWYAIGALRIRQGQRAAACEAFSKALIRVDGHVLAAIGLQAMSGSTDPLAGLGREGGSPRGTAVDAAIARAVAMTLAGHGGGAATVVDAALVDAPPGSSGWWLPIAPILETTHAAWAPVLARVRARAA